MVRLNTQVLVISFGTDFWARAWLRETGSPFPLLLDPERRVYRAYGLQRSALRAWTPRVIWYYLRRFALGDRLHPPQEDPHQLGGDFIVDALGVVRLAHREERRRSAGRPPATLEERLAFWINLYNVMEYIDSPMRWPPSGVESMPTADIP